MNKKHLKTTPTPRARNAKKKITPTINPKPEPLTPLQSDWENFIQNTPRSTVAEKLREFLF